MESSLLSSGELTSPNTGKCMFCDGDTTMSIACDTCWGYIVYANVTTAMVFGADEHNEVSDTEITELKIWDKTGND